MLETTELILPTNSALETIGEQPTTATTNAWVGA